jgi:hypothetical protein
VHAHANVDSLQSISHPAAFPPPLLLRGQIEKNEEDEFYVIRSLHNNGGERSFISENPLRAESLTPCGEFEFPREENPVYFLLPFGGVPLILGEGQSEIPTYVSLRWGDRTVTIGQDGHVDIA